MDIGEIMYLRTFINNIVEEIIFFQSSNYKKD